MSRKRAGALAASLAAMVNGNTISKGYGYAVRANDLLPVARSLVRIERQTAKMNRRIERNGKIIAALTGSAGEVPGPGFTAIPAADVLAAAEAQQLARLRQMHVNGHDRNLPTYGRPDVPPNHSG